MTDDKKTDNLPASSRFDWSDMRVFLAVAEHKSMNAASRALQMSQPTVSQRIRELELRLNTQLLVRSKAGVVLTEAGERLREEAMPMLRAANSIDRALREADDKLDGRVKLSAPEGVLTFWIAPRIPAFQQANPKIALSIDGGFWPDDPVHDELHVSLQYDSKGFEENAVEPLATVHYGAFATERYFETYGFPKTQADLVAHRTIHHSALQQQRETWDPKAEAVRTLSDYYVETNSSAALTMALLADGGVTFIPTFTASYFDGLVMVGEKPAASPILYLAHDPRVARVARVARVVQWLKTIFDGATYPWFRPEFVHPRDFAMKPGAGRLSFEPPTV